jgi:hypothetical protein
MTFDELLTKAQFKQFLFDHPYVQFKIASCYQCPIAVAIVAGMHLRYCESDAVSKPLVTVYVTRSKVKTRTVTPLGPLIEYYPVPTWVSEFITRIDKLPPRGTTVDTYINGRRALAIYEEIENGS